MPRPQKCVETNRCIPHGYRLVVKVGIYPKIEKIFSIECKHFNRIIRKYFKITLRLLSQTRTC